MNRIVANWLNFQLLLALLLVALTGIFGASASPYELQIIVLTIIFAIMGVGWTIAGGLGGQMLVGYITFFGIGAYTNGILFTQFGVSPWLNLVIGGVLGAAAAVLMARLCLRYGLKDDYFGLFTVAMTQVFMVIFYNWSLAGKAVGISISITQQNFWAMSFPDKTEYLFIALALLLLAVLLSYVIQRTRFGYYLAAIREGPDAAEAVGVDVTRTKVMAVGISSGVAGTCGAFFSQFTTFIDPGKVFGLGLNFELLLPAVLGGRLSLIGPLLGSIVLRPTKDVLRGMLGGQADALYLIVYGLLLVVAILVLPKGIAGIMEVAHARYFGGRRDK
ncbi:MAG: branched-chain amino acid ABC transporter permease [Parvibaculaceae bacterium]